MLISTNLAARREYIRPRSKGKGMIIVTIQKRARIITGMTLSLIKKNKDLSVCEIVEPSLYLTVILYSIEFSNPSNASSSATY